MLSARCLALGTVDQHTQTDTHPEDTGSGPIKRFIVWIRDPVEFRGIALSRSERRPLAGPVNSVAHGKTTENRSARSRSSVHVREFLVLSRERDQSRGRVRGLPRAMVSFLFICLAAARLRFLGYDPTEAASSRLDASAAPSESWGDWTHLKRSSEDMHAGRDMWTLPRQLAALILPSIVQENAPSPLLHLRQTKRSISTTTYFWQSSSLLASPNRLRRAVRWIESWK